MKRAMVCVCLLMMVIAGWWGRPLTAQACSPAPWYYETLASQSAAAGYGTLTDVSKDGRRATLLIEQYAGPGVAPRTIVMPATVSTQQGENDGCPDFSTRFVQGHSAMVFFKYADNGQMTLLHLNWITSLLVQEGQVTVDMHGQTQPIDLMMQQYAEDKAFSMQTPAEEAKTWNLRDGRSVATVWPYLIIAGTVIILASGYGFRQYKLRQKYK